MSQTKRHCAKKGNKWHFPRLCHDSLLSKTDSPQHSRLIWLLSSSNSGHCALSRNAAQLDSTVMNRKSTDLLHPNWIMIQLFPFFLIQRKFVEHVIFMACSLLKHEFREDEELALQSERNECDVSVLLLQVFVFQRSFCWFTKVTGHDASSHQEGNFNASVSMGIQTTTTKICRKWRAKFACRSKLFPKQLRNEKDGVRYYWLLWNCFAHFLQVF